MGRLGQKPVKFAGIGWEGLEIRLSFTVNYVLIVHVYTS